MATRVPLRLDIIGAGPAYTDRAGATGAAYLVRHGSTSLLLDLGQGSFPRLAAALEPSELDAVVISHLHPDHFVDLVALRHYLRWQFQPGRRVRVIAPAGIDRRLDALHDEPGFAAATFDLETLRPGSFTVGSLTVEAAKVRHTADSYAVRVTADPRTGPGLLRGLWPCRGLEPLLRAGDTLLTEVSFGPGPVAVGAEHLDGPAVGDLAARARVGRVLLTHLQMGFDPDATVSSVEARYAGPVRLVSPGDAIDLD